MVQMLQAFKVLSPWTETSRNQYCGLDILKSSGGGNPLLRPLDPPLKEKKMS